MFFIIEIETPEQLATQYVVADRKGKIQITRKINKYIEDEIWTIQEKKLFNQEKEKLVIGHVQKNIKKTKPKKDDGEAHENGEKRDLVNAQLLKICEENLTIKNFKDYVPDEIKGPNYDENQSKIIFVKNFSSWFWVRMTQTISDSVQYRNFKQKYSWDLVLVTLKRNKSKLEKLISLIQFEDQDHLENVIIKFFRSNVAIVLHDLIKEKKQQIINEQQDKEKLKQVQEQKENEVVVTQEMRNQIKQNQTIEESATNYDKIKEAMKKLGR